MLSELTQSLPQNEPSVQILSLVKSTSLPKGMLISRALDFWMLGGASFGAWLVSVIASHSTNLNDGFDRHIMGWPALFSGLSVICNYPHFMSSYRVAYGNGLRKIRGSWFAMIIVPVALLILFGVAFQTHDIEISSKYFKTEDLGEDLLRLGVWLMWLTVGWHYAKQSFGVMLRYAGYDRYELKPLTRKLLRLSLLSVVPVNFMLMIMSLEDRGGDHFQDLAVSSVHIPKLLLQVSEGVSVALVLAFTALLVLNYKKHKKIPSINFITPYVAFFLWWWPGLWPMPFVMIMIPFFHSLQYLPFAYKRIQSDHKLSSKNNFTTVITINIILMLGAGVALFDLIPSYLDATYSTRFSFGSSFFMIVTALFFNVHHFFVDSAIWRSPKKLAGLKA